MTDALFLDPAASYGVGGPGSFDLNPQSGNGSAVASAARFQNALAEAMLARDGDSSASEPDASASASLASVGATASAPVPALSNIAPQQASDGQPATSSALGHAWDWTKHQASAASQVIGSFDAAHGHVLTRAAGAAQAVGAVAEGLTGAAVAGIGGVATATGAGAAPGVPAIIGGGALMANALDNGVAGVRTAWTGDFHHTLTSQAAGTGVRALGASDQTAERIASGVDLAQGVAAGGASIAAGIARKGASVAGNAGRIGETGADAAKTADLAGTGSSAGKAADVTATSTGEAASASEGAATTGNTAAHGAEGATDAGKTAEASAKTDETDKIAGTEAQTIPLSRSRFGHTFEAHGQDVTEFLTNRARAMGQPNGQFLDNQAAARFIQENLNKTKGGPVSIPIPQDFPARIINPDGSFSPAQTVRLVPGGKGVKTAFPEL